ncbi:MAG: CPXCG motif-containing cysteine-rich protein [Myxococcales bacterium]|nr:CPXCG motif-containing cysteine-rich protein [Myxococcales bacterium]MDD9965420.1 CPXCG motif-containing cysteine-rich protein [Myxococcales bacterium]
MDDTKQVCCPYCSEVVELYVDPETWGTLVQDCDVCCRPWQLHVARDEDGDPIVSVSRAQ